MDKVSSVNSLSFSTVMNEQKLGGNLLLFLVKSLPNFQWYTSSGVVGMFLKLFPSNYETNGDTYKDGTDKEFI